MRQRKKRARREYVRSWNFVNQVLGLRCAEKHFLAHWLDYLGKNDSAWPSIRTMAFRCGVSRTWITKTLARLMRARVLVRVPGSERRSLELKPGPTLVALKCLWVETKDEPDAFPRRARDLLAEARPRRRVRMRDGFLEKVDAIREVERELVLEKVSPRGGQPVSPRGGHRCHRMVDTVSPRGGLNVYH